jgi:hypothetical protein
MHVAYAAAEHPGCISVIAESCDARVLQRALSLHQPVSIQPEVLQIIIPVILPMQRHEKGPALVIFSVSHCFRDAATQVGVVVSGAAAAQQLDRQNVVKLAWEESSSTN